MTPGTIFIWNQLLQLIPHLVGVLEDVDGAGRHDVAEVVEAVDGGQATEAPPTDVTGKPVVPALLDDLRDN